ncbi:MAG: hypothetical protein V1487_00300 [bacterium]
MLSIESEVLPIDYIADPTATEEWQEADDGVTKGQEIPDGD